MEVEDRKVEGGEVEGRRVEGMDTILLFLPESSLHLPAVVSYNWKRNDILAVRFSCCGRNPEYEMPVTA